MNEEEKSLWPPSWFVNEQKKEDLIEEILFNSKKTNLTHLKRIGWTNGFPDRYRSLSWQLLLHYLPTSKSKREQTLRRKRIEYHRHISKHYFEFDFCLTDRKLSSAPSTSATAATTTPETGPSSSVSTSTTKDAASVTSSSSAQKLISPNSKRRFSITSKLQKLQSDTLFQAALMPLFSQPSSSAASKGSGQGGANDMREDSLLLQIRNDINQMVKIPTNSASSSSRSGRSRSRKRRQQRRRSNSWDTSSTFSSPLEEQSSISSTPSSSPSIKSRKSKKQDDNKKQSAFPSHDADDIHGENATTKNRLFSNPTVKSSLERILYLWSIKMKNTSSADAAAEGKYYRSTIMFSNTSPTSRYIPGMVDIVYPLYLTILHGYVWDTHVSTSLQNDDSESDDSDDDSIGGFRHKSSKIGKLSGKSKSEKNRDDLLVRENSFLKRLRLKEEEQGMREEKGDDDDDGDGNDGEDKISSLPNIDHKKQSDVLEDEVRQSKLKFCQELSIGKGIDQIPEEIMDEIEADTFWCLENMMNAIQDFRYNDAFFEKHSTTGGLSSGNKFQLCNKDGLQKMIILTEKVTQRVDPTLYRHLKDKGVEFQWFVFRWINTLQVRSMNEKCITRLWDTCLCEEVDKDSKGSLGGGLNYFTTFGFNPKRSRKRLHLSGFLSFQVYISVALLHEIRESILSEESFEDILYYLRNVSLDDWKVEEVSVLLSQAFVWKETFRNSEDFLLASSTTRYGDNTISSWIKKSHWPPRKETSRPAYSVETISKILHDADGKVLSL